jgi:glycosyltransferase involved in cell wall biosynthesis
MQISFLEYKLSINGSIRLIVELANQLVRRGHQVTIYAIDKRLAWLPTIAQLKPLSAFATDQHEAVVFNLLTRDFYNLMDQCPARAKAFYLMGMPGADDLPLLKHCLLNRNGASSDRLLGDVLYHPDIVTMCNGSWMADWLRDEAGIEIERAIDGVNFDLFFPVTLDHFGPFRIMTSGDPRPHKGFDTVKEAVEIIKKAVGRSVELSTYWGKGIPQAEMAAALSSADLFVDGQRRAGWSNPVAEAMACGLPVITADNGGVRDFARHNETALITPVGDATAMADWIVGMIRYPQERQRLSAAGLAMIRQFTYDKTATAVERILEARL